MRTGRKWKAEEETDKIITALQHSDIIGHVQTSRSGLGNSGYSPFSQMNRKERRKAIVGRAKRDEENSRHTELVTQSQQGQLTSWEDEVEGREVKWSHLWKWSNYRISFLIKSTFDMMPSPANLFKWKLSADDKCACGGRGTLFHIISNCPLGLRTRYTWRHNQVLRVIMDTVKAKLDDINSGKRPQIPDPRRPMHFHREGQTATRRTLQTIDDPEWSGAWEMKADLKGEGFGLPVSLPVETEERPDMAVFCEVRKKLRLLELTVCWESGMEAARLRKEKRYATLVKRCEEQGWGCECLPIEVGARGFVGNRTMSLFHHLGLSKLDTRKMIDRVQEAAESASRFVWNHRSDQDVATH